MPLEALNISQCKLMLGYEIKAIYDLLAIGIVMYTGGETKFTR